MPSNEPQVSVSEAELKIESLITFLISVLLRPEAASFDHTSMGYNAIGGLLKDDTGKAFWVVHFAAWKALGEQFLFVVFI